MKIRILCVFLLTLLLASCGEYNKVLKSTDPELKFTYAKKYFDEKKYSRTTTLLEEILPTYTGLSKEEEILFLLSQAYFYNADYDISTQYFSRYFNKFPKGEYTELARFNAAYGLYLDSPDVRLDQTNTLRAIQGFQNFLEYHPQSEKAKDAQDYMFELQEKLAYKEMLAARLYLNLELYLGNNYQSCVVTAAEALRKYPFTKYADDLQYLMAKAKFEMTKKSYDEKKPVRYREFLDEYYNYKNSFPEGKYTDELEKYFEQADKFLKKEDDKNADKDESSVEKDLSEK